MTADHDLTGLRRGNSFHRTFRFKDVDGDPVDLTGSVLVFVIEAGAVRLVKSTADGTLAMPDPGSGEVVLSRRRGRKDRHRRLIPATGGLLTGYGAICQAPRTAVQ